MKGLQCLLGSGSSSGIGWRARLELGNVGIDNLLLPFLEAIIPG